LGLGGLARQGLADARHAIQELRSDPVQNMGLQGALREMLSALEARSGLVARMDVSGQESDLTLEEAGALYRIAEEALLNVERHARAEHVALALEQSRVLVRLSVVDDGRGFDPRQVPADRYGLMGMHERAAIIGGTLEVTSAPDQGTTVRCTLSR
jgi:signal transduction histidine kinase